MGASAHGALSTRPHHARIVQTLREATQCLRPAWARTDQPPAPAPAPAPAPHLHLCRWHVSPQRSGSVDRRECARGDQVSLCKLRRSAVVLRSHLQNQLGVARSHRHDARTGRRQRRVDLTHRGDGLDDGTPAQSTRRGRVGDLIDLALQRRISDRSRHARQQHAVPWRMAGGRVGLSGFESGVIGHPCPRDGFDASGDRHRRHCGRFQPPATTRHRARQQRGNEHRYHGYRSVSNVGGAVGLWRDHDGSARCARDAAACATTRS